MTDVEKLTQAYNESVTRRKNLLKDVNKLKGSENVIATICFNAEGMIQGEILKQIGHFTVGK